MWYSKLFLRPELKGILVSRRSIISVPRRSPACDSCPFRVNSRRTIGSNFPRGIDSFLPQCPPALPSLTRAPGSSIRESRPGCGLRDSGSRDATCCTTDESDGSRTERFPADNIWKDRILCRTIIFFVPSFPYSISRKSGHNYRLAQYFVIVLLLARGVFVLEPEFCSNVFL